MPTSTAVTTERTRPVRVARLVAGSTAIGAGLTLIGVFGASSSPAKSVPTEQTTTTPATTAAPVRSGDSGEIDDNGVGSRATAPAQPNPGGQPGPPVTSSRGS